MAFHEPLVACAGVACSKMYETEPWPTVSVSLPESNRGCRRAAGRGLDELLQLGARLTELIVEDQLAHVEATVALSVHGVSRA